LAKIFSKPLADFLQTIKNCIRLRKETVYLISSMCEGKTNCP